MEYLVAGFERYQFILTPEELDEVLDGFHFVVNNTHVPAGYVESLPSEYLSVYQKMYRNLADGHKLVWGQDNHLFASTGLTTNLNLCKYGRLHEYRGSMYQLSCFDEPCVIIYPFTVYIMQGDGKVSASTRVSYAQYPECVAGLELSYPKQIQYECGSSYEALKSTHDLESYNDFLTLKSRIKAVTKGLKFEVAGKEMRPSVRISQAALQDVEHFFCFTNNRCVFR